MRRNSKQREEVRRYLVAFHSLGNSFASEIGVPPLSGRQMFKGVAVLHPIPEVGWGNAHAGFVLLGNGFPYGNHTIEIRECKGPENQGVYVAENRGVGADAQRERNYRDRGEPRALAQHAAARSESPAVTRSCARLLHELLQFFLGHYLAVEEVHFSLRVLGEARIVRDHADGRALAMQILQQFHHGFAVARVEVSGRFVGQQNRGLSAQRARHCHTLLLTAGELRRVMPDAMRHAHSFQRFHHARLAVGRRHPLPVGQRQLDVFVHRQIADQVETLKDESDLLVANARALGKIQVLDRLAVQE